MFIIASYFAVSSIGFSGNRIARISNAFSPNPPSPRFEIEASFTSQISNQRSGRLIWTVARFSFQMGPLPPTLATLITICAARAEGSPSALLLCLSLPLRGRRSASVALYGFVSMARLIKPFSLSLWASAWALAVKAACFQSLRVYFYGCINFFLSNRNFFYILHATMLHNFGFTAIYVGNYFIFRYCCRKYFS